MHSAASQASGHTSSGRSVAAELLLNAGADANAKTRDGLTPLQVSAKNIGEATHFIKVLLKGGADANVKDKNGATLLHYAAISGKSDLAEALLNAGADANAKNRNGSTPLHLVVQAGGFQVAEALLNAGADVNAKDRNGNTPLQLATKNDVRDDLKKLLSNAKADPKAKEVQTAKVYSPEATKELIETLYTAARFSEGYDFEKLQALLKAGADVNAKEPSRGRTALHWEAKWGSGAEEIKVLLKAGADVNARDKYGNTPLDLAKEALNHRKHMMEMEMDRQEIQQWRRAIELTEDVIKVLQEAGAR